jgi:hypothetical protein
MTNPQEFGKAVDLFEQVILNIRAEHSLVRLVNSWCEPVEQSWA